MEKNFDERQLHQMKALIERLKTRRVDVSKFVSDQWALVEMLKNVDSAWKTNYFSLVNEIEDLYSAAIDQGQKQMTEKDIVIVDNILRKMILLISEIIQ